MPVFDDMVLDGNKLILDSPSQDTYIQLRDAGLLDGKAALFCLLDGHTITIWNPAKSE